MAEEILKSVLTLISNYKKKVYIKIIITSISAYRSFPISVFISLHLTYSRVRLEI